jgi:hypothetical protein
MKIGNRVQYKKRGKIITGEVIDIFPDGNLEVMSDFTFKMLDPEDVIKILPPKRRIKYIPFFEKGGKIKLAQNKWRQVYREYLDGDLTHGTTGKTVTDKDMAMAIAYSEARKIHPLYNVYANGGSVTTNFDEICLHPQPNNSGIYDFNVKRDKKKYYGSIQLPSDERGLVNIIWDNTEKSPKPKDWNDLEVAVTNRTYQYADNKFGLGGFIVGTLLGGYLGFKSGRIMKQNKDPFSTERKIGEKSKQVAKSSAERIKRVSEKVSERRAKKKAVEVKKEGGSIDMFPPSGDKLFFRVLNKYKSYTNISIQPGKADKYHVNIVVHGFEDDGEFTIIDTNSSMINLSERNELIKKIRTQNILESRTF